VRFVVLDKALLAAAWRWSSGTARFFHQGYSLKPCGSSRKIWNC
jgi:hypothetical protein